MNIFDKHGRIVLAAMLAAIPAAQACGEATQPAPGGPIHAFRLYTGPDNNSHVEEGIVTQGVSTSLSGIHFKTTAPHSAYGWHNDPEPQYVLTLTGTLKFSTKTGETFVLRPGDVLIAEDHVGTGHDWRMLGDQPWTRAYAVITPGAKTAFVPKGTPPAR